MTDAPERIWAWVDYDGNWDGTWLADSQTLQPERLPDAEYIRADLAKPRVKPLEWKEYCTANGRAMGYAINPLVTYHITQKFFPEAFFSVEVGEGSFLSADTMDGAKAAAQVDYERRILEALE